VLTENGPSMSELTRRIIWLEGRLDARTVSQDVYTAEKAARSIEIEALTRRVDQLERASAAALRMVITAFLGLVVEAILLVFNLYGKAG
jgi:hypothetical protein